MTDNKPGGIVVDMPTTPTDSKEVQKALKAALAAEKRRDEADAIAVQRAGERSVAVAELARVAGSQAAAAKLLGISQPNVFLQVVRAAVYLTKTTGGPAAAAQAIGITEDEVTAMVEKAASKKTASKTAVA